MPIPPLKPLESTMLKGMHYDPASKTLTVQFAGGKHYAYDDVTMERATALEGADSPGRYFNDQIRGNHIGREVFGDDE